VQDFITRERLNGLTEAILLASTTQLMSQGEILNKKNRKRLRGTERNRARKG